MVRKSFTGLFFSRSMPSIMCSGPTATLASLIASSLLKASISDTLGDIWLLFAIFFPFFYLNDTKLHILYETNIVPC